MDGGEIKRYLTTLARMYFVTFYLRRSCGRGAITILEVSHLTGARLPQGSEATRAPSAGFPVPMNRIK